MTDKILVLTAAVFLLPAGNVYAGGVAARQQPGARVHRQIQLDPSAPPRPGVWPTPVPPSPPFGKGQSAAPDPVPQRQSRAAYPQSKVLVSASGAATGPQPRQISVKGEAPGVTMAESLRQLFDLLDQSGRIWLRIDDMNYRVLVVSRYQDLFRQKGVVIRKPPVYFTRNSLPLWGRRTRHCWISRSPAFCGWPRSWNMILITGKTVTCRPGRF